MKRAISFSVYGSELKYILGAIKNAQLASSVFPNWETIFYVSDDIPGKFTKELKSYADNIVMMSKPVGARGMFWRFITATDSSYERVIFRDTDSRLSHRDAVAVQQWIDSGSALHVIRDHPMHNAPMLGGLWGIMPSCLRNFREALESYEPVGYYGEDQEFLWENVYRPLRKSRFVHDEFFLREFNRNCIPLARKAGEFLGESFDECDRVNSRLRDQIMKLPNRPLARQLLKFKSVILRSIGK